MNRHLALFLAVSSLAAGTAFAGVQDKMKMKEVDDDLSRTLENHINTDGGAGHDGLNAADCLRADLDKGKPCRELPKAQWAHVKGVIDWASFNGKTDATHGFDEVKDKTTEVVMSLTLATQEGSWDERNAYRKAMREQIKTIRVYFDPKAGEDPTLELKGGEFKAGFNWNSDVSRTKIRDWLVKHL